MNRKRVVWVDIAKFICIFCVMNSHLESVTDPVFRLYDPFYLSLFFFCSGYVYHHRAGFGVFLKKKVHQLLLPWFFLSNANILLSQILSFNDHGSLAEEVFWNLLQIRGMGDGLWFIAALFVAFIPFYHIIDRYEKKKLHRSAAWLMFGGSFVLFFISRAYVLFVPDSLFPWGSAAFPWHLEDMFFAVFYMVSGYLFREKWEETFDRLHTRGFRCLLWAAYLGLVYLLFYLPGGNLCLIFPVDRICDLVGCLAVISVCKILPENRFVLYIGQNTLLCFALHGKVYSVLQTIFRKLAPAIYSGILHNTFLSSAFSLVFTLALCVILLLPIWIINRWFPFLAGKKKASAAAPDTCPEKR